MRTSLATGGLSFNRPACGTGADRAMTAWVCGLHFKFCHPAEQVAMIAASKVYKHTLRRVPGGSAAVLQDGV